MDMSPMPDSEIESSQEEWQRLKAELVARFDEIDRLQKLTQPLGVKIKAALDRLDASPEPLTGEVKIAAELEFEETVKDLNRLTLLEKQLEAANKERDEVTVQLMKLAPRPPDDKVN